MSQTQHVWKDIPAKYLYRLVDDRVTSLADLDVPLLSVSIYRGIVPRSEITDKEAWADDFMNYKRCSPGDVVINRMSAYQGAIGISTYEGIVSPEYLVLRPSEKAHPSFLCFLIKSSWFVSQMAARVRGIGSVEQGNVRTPRINPFDLGAIPVRLPSCAIQRAIAHYLEAETGRIDSLIEKKRRMTALIREENVASLDATLSWLGERWPTVRLRWCMRRIVDGTHGTYERVDKGLPLLSAKNLLEGRVHISDDESLISEADYRQIIRSRCFRPGDILVGVIGGSIGNVARLQDTDPLAFQRSVACLSPGPSYLGDFLFHVVRSHHFQHQMQLAANESAQAGVYLGGLADIQVPFPPLDEQARLSASFEHDLDRVERLVAGQVRAVTLLNERRAALITAAVTGDLDIPGVAA